MYVFIIFQNEATVDVLNNTGDTPLHRAAYTGRVVSTGEVNPVN